MAYGGVRLTRDCRVRSLRSLPPTGRLRDGSFTPRAKKARSAPDPVDIPVMALGVRCLLSIEGRPVRQSQTLDEAADYFSDNPNARISF